MTRARALGIVTMLAFGSIASAEAKVDWAAGFVTARGVGVADRHAPSPAIARSTARRGADDAAKAAIAAAVGALPIAGGGTLGERMKDAKVAAAVKAAIAHPVTLAADPDTDGAWTVTLGVPLEALRQAIDGGPRALSGNDTGAPVVVVHAAAVVPALGYRVGGAGVAIAWRPAAEPGLPTTTATRSGTQLTLAQPLGSPAALYIVVP